MYMQCHYIRMYTLLLYSAHSVVMHAYSYCSAAIYSTDTVTHCIVTLCSPYTVSLCSVNTVSLISLKLYSIHSVTIHAYNVTIQCTHAMSIYSVQTVIIKYAQCNYTVYTLSLYGEHGVTIILWWTHAVSLYMYTLLLRTLLYTVSLNSHYCHYTVLTMPPYSVHSVTYTQCHYRVLQCHYKV